MKRLTITALLLAVASHVAAQSVTPEVLKQAGTAADKQAGSWLSYGKTTSETRYSPLNQIDASNV